MREKDSGWQDEVCPYCGAPFSVKPQKPRETYLCLECKNKFVVIKESPIVSIKSILLAQARQELGEYERALKEGFPVNLQAVESCKGRIRRLKLTIRF